MNKILFCFFIIFLLTAGNTNAQLWKQYADSARNLANKNEPTRAIDLYIQVVNELKKDSIETVTYARTIERLSILYTRVGQYDKAMPYQEENKQRWEKLVGKNHVDYFLCCNRLAVLNMYLSNYEISESLFIETRDGRAKLLGKEHSDYAVSCNNLANLYVYMGKHSKAEPLFIEALNIKAKISGKENVAYADGCSNLGVLYVDMGQYEKAEKLYLEAKEIRERILGKKHSDYGESLNNLAGIYQYMGLYAKAEPLYLESKEICENTLGKEHPDYGRSCNNLAALYADMGENEKAELLYKEAEQLRERVLGKEHPDYLSTLVNFAIFYASMGQYDKAEPRYLENLRTLAKKLGIEHPLYATGCINLGAMYRSKGQYEKTEPLYLEAKQINEKALGKEHPDYAACCHYLGDLYMNMRQYEKAVPLYAEAKQIREKILGKEHPAYAATCNSLAVMYQETGQYDKAEPLLLEAKSIREKAYGKEHEDYAGSCMNLANLYWNMSANEKAQPYYTEAFYTKYQLLKKAFNFTSEKEKQFFTQQISDQHQNYLSFMRSVNSVSGLGFLYDLSLANRNLILSSSQQMRKSVFYSGDSVFLDKYNKWMEAKEQLAYWLVKPVAERDGRDSLLEEKTDALEKELTRITSGFNKDLQGFDVSWKDVQRSLKPEEGAIEFAVYQYYDGKRFTDSTYYCALVTRKDKPEPVLIQLCEQSRLSKLLNRKAIDKEQKQNIQYGDASLYNLVWAPLEKSLDGIRKVYFSAAGLLHRVSFAAIRTNGSQNLSDKYQLEQLNTTASVVEQKNISITVSDSIQLYGGVQYDVDSTALWAATMPYHSTSFFSRSIPEDLLRGDSWKYLSGTDKEITEIERIGKVKKFTISVNKGMQASEEAFKSLGKKNSPGIIHIATHGFFFPDPGFAKSNVMQATSTGDRIFMLSENPLIRSGLVLAGANNAWKGKPVAGVEDGILTAYEVSNMYLPKTKLVVLSACETGLGDIQGSEGVYGLQRAFKIAGTENLVMSLWKVPDAETSEFMEEFYRNLFDKQMISTAFYNAQTVLKNKYRNNPYKWAAWVLVR